jgi:hypothetical protein
MKKITLLSVLIAFFIHASAQEQTEKWYFGVLAGVDFSPATPVALTNGVMNTSEGCSAISDTAGNLLFYSDGQTVWNRNHTPMPNGTGLLAGVTCTQAALIVPKPGTATIYYEFTLDDTGGLNGLRYSVIDMTLDNGFGDVTAEKNIFIRNNLTEKLTGVAQANGTDYWIAVHENGNDTFYVYSLTAAGLDTNAVISQAGIIHSNAQIQNTYGQMKFSPCGDMLALAAGYLNTVEIFHFDNLTGVVTPFVTTPMTDHVYGIEFSSQSTMLYVSTYDPGQTLIQYDLTSGVPATIIASQTHLSVTPAIYGLQLASNEKIYVCKSFNQWLGVINSPNVAGQACNYSDFGIDLDPLLNNVTSGLSLPGFVQSWLKGEGACAPTGIDAAQTFAELTIFPNPASDKLIVRSPEFGDKSVFIIYNALGKKVYEQSLTSNLTFQTIDISQLSPEIYFYSVHNSLNQKIAGGSFSVMK